MVIALISVYLLLAKVQAERVAHTKDESQTLNSVRAVETQAMFAEGRRCKRKPICEGVTPGTAEDNACSEYPGALIRCDEYLSDLRRKYGIPHPAIVMQRAGLTGTSVGEAGEGKSGASFLSAFDGKIFLKTMTPTDLETFKSTMSFYPARMASTLLVQFYGVVMIPKIHRKASSFGCLGSAGCTGDDCFNIWLIMNNFIPIPFDTKLDLKGSEWGRNSTRGDKVLKDNYVRENGMLFWLPPKLYEDFFWDARQDAAMLAAANLIDYSLILGFETYHLPLCEKDDCEAPLVAFSDNAEPQYYVDAMHAVRVSNQVYTESNQLHSHWSDIMKLMCTPKLQRNDGCHITTKDFLNRRNGEVTVRCYGIIDLLKNYGIKAAIEHVALQVGKVKQKGEASAISPSAYAKRFINFMDESFDVDDRLLHAVPEPRACTRFGIDSWSGAYPSESAD